MAVIVKNSKGGYQIDGKGKIYATRRELLTSGKFPKK